MIVRCLSHAASIGPILDKRSDIINGLQIYRLLSQRLGCIKLFGHEKSLSSIPVRRGEMNKASAIEGIEGPDKIACTNLPLFSAFGLIDIK
jgi:hypothetical protein